MNHKNCVKILQHAISMLNNESSIHNDYELSSCATGWYIHNKQTPFLIFIDISTRNVKQQPTPERYFAIYYPQYDEGDSSVGDYGGYYNDHDTPDHITTNIVEVAVAACMWIKSVDMKTQLDNLAEQFSLDEYDEYVYDEYVYDEYDEYVYDEE